jgi:hypothetical protein
MMEFLPGDLPIHCATRRECSNRRVDELGKFGPLMTHTILMCVFLTDVFDLCAKLVSSKSIILTISSILAFPMTRVTPPDVML